MIDKRMVNLDIDLNNDLIAKLAQLSCMYNETISETISEILWNAVNNVDVDNNQNKNSQPNK